MKLQFVTALGLALMATGTFDCNPVTPAELGTVEQTVLDDLKAGKTPEQIEADIAGILCKAPAQTACVDTVIVLNDVLQFLLDAKVIPSGVIPQALAARTVEANKLAARAGH